MGGDSWILILMGIILLNFQVYNGCLTTMDQLGRLGDIPATLQPAYKVGLVSTTGQFQINWSCKDAFQYLVYDFRSVWEQILERDPVLRTLSRSWEDHQASSRTTWSISCYSWRSCKSRRRGTSPGFSHHYQAFLTTALPMSARSETTFASWYSDSHLYHFQGKILPQLINAFEFGGAGSAILTPVFKIGKELDTQVAMMDHFQLLLISWPARPSFRPMLWCVLISPQRFHSPGVPDKNCPLHCQTFLKQWQKR